MSASKGRKFDPTENLGIQKVQRVLTSFGWIVRDDRTDDFGVDLSVEYVGPDQKPTGRRLYVQVKSGPSYFSKSNDTHVHHYTDAAHVDYWANHPAAVAIVLHDEATDRTIWEWTSEAVELGKSWRISIPSGQALDDKAKPIWAAKALEDRNFDRAKAEELGREVEREINARGGAETRSTAFQAHDDLASGIQSIAQADLGNGELAPAAMAQLARLFDEKLKAFRSPALQPSPDQQADSRRSDEDAALHAQIDQLREIRVEGDAAVAFRRLEALIPKIDAAAQPYAYYRARTNHALSALDMGLEEDAIKELVQVWEIEPKNPQAIAHLALARLLQRDYRAAYDAAIESLSYEGAPSHVLGVLFGAAARLNMEQPPVHLVPKKYQESSDAEFALTEYLRVKSDPSWIERAISGHEKYPQEQAFKRLWAYAVLEQAASERQALGGGRFTIPSEAIRAAAEALRAEVERKVAAGYHDMEELANEATNAAVAYRLLDDYQPAIDLLRRVLQFTGHQANAVRMLGLLEAMHGNEPAAMEVLRAVPDDGEARLLAAEILGQSDPAKGLSEVLSISETIIPDHHRSSRWVIAAKLAIILGDEAQAARAIAELRKNPHNGPLADIMSGRLREREGASPEDLAAALIATATALGDDASLTTRLSLAEELRRLEAALPASRLLDGLVDLTRDTDASRLYVRLLATSGRDQDFYRAFQTLPASAQNDPDLVWLRAAHAFNHGDLDVAEQQSSALCALQPTELKPVLLRLETLIRRRRDKGIHAILEKSVESLSASDLSDRVRLARILVGYGYYDRGLGLLYRLLLENRDNPRLWVNFGSAVLATSRQKDSTFAVLEVASDVSVTLSFEHGENTEIVVEPSPDLRKLDPESREPDHPDVRSLLGLAVGAPFTLPDGRKGKISALRHKFVAKMQSVLKQFEERFPASDGFRGVQMDVESEGGLDEIKALLKERADFVREEAQSYEAGNLPLAVFAHRVGISTIDAAGGLAQIGRKFHVAMGNPPERSAAAEALRANGGNGAVVDAQTFNTIWQLGALDAVQAVVGRLHYSISTMDVLQSRLELIADSARDQHGHQTLSYQDGNIALVSVSQDDVKRQQEDQIRAIEWLEKNAVLCPVNLPDDVPDDLREAFTSFNAPVLDELLIAKERHLLLLVDDLRLRQWARGFVTHTAWTHAVLGFAVDEGKADFSTYTVWSAKLLARGQNYLGMTSHAFIEALSKDVESRLRFPGEVFLNLTTCLGGKSAEVQSHVRVVCQIIFVIWKESRFLNLRASATGALLRAVTSARTEDYALIIGVIIRVFRKEWWITDYIRSWVRGHFLPI